MAELKRLIEIGIDARKAKQGAREVDEAMDLVVNSTRQGRDELGRFTTKQDMAAKAAGGLKTALFGLVGGFSAMLIIRNIIKDVGDFEAALVDLSKVSDLQGDSLQRFGETAQDLARKLPGTAIEMINTAASAARLDVATEDLEQFTATIARFRAGSSDAFGADEIATNLGTILGVTNEATSNVENLAGAILILADRTRASERQVVDFSTEISRAIAVFGVASVKAAALAAATASAGGEAASASTAFFEAFNTIDRATREGGKQLEILQELMGMTGDEIEQLFADDATAAFSRFIAGLASVQAQGGKVIPILEALELGESRIARNLLPLVNNYSILSQALEEVADESRNVSKLYEEVERSSVTLQQGQERLRDSLATAKHEIVDGSLPAWKALFDALTAAVDRLGGAEASATTTGKAMTILGRTVTLAVAAIGGLIALDVAANLLKMAAAAGVLKLNFTAIAASAAGAAVAVGALVAAFSLAALGGFSLGNYFHDEFRVVQETAQSAITVVLELWERLKYSWKLAVIGMKEVWLDFVNSIGFVFGIAVEEVGNQLVALENLLKGTLLERDFGGTALQNIGGALKTGALGSDLFDADAARKSAKDAFEAAIDEIESVQTARFEEIAQQFGENGERMGEGFVDGTNRAITENLTGLSNSVTGVLEDVATRVTEALREAAVGADTFTGAMDGANAEIIETAAVAPQAETNLANINKLLGDTEKEASAAFRSVSRLVKELAVEADLLARGIPGDSRERAIELLRIQEQLLELSNDELDKMIDTLKSDPPSLDELLADNPEKLEKVKTLLAGIEDELERLKQAEEFEQFAEDIGDSFGTLFDDLVFGAKSVEDAFEGLVRNISNLIFEQLVTNQISQFIQGLLTSGGGFNFLFSAKGNAFSGGHVIPFARGGIVDGPTIFPMANGGAGLMGEAGPEAILPLARNDRGELGVKTNGGGAASSVVNVRMNISTPDVQGFERSESQVARAVSRQMRRVVA